MIPIYQRFHDSRVNFTYGKNTLMSDGDLFIMCFFLFLLLIVGVFLIMILKDVLKEFSKS